MTNEEILNKVIEKAVGNGWGLDNWLIDNWSFPPKFGDEEREEALKIISKSYYVNIIFSHDFAKALWGEETREVWAGDFEQFNDGGFDWDAVIYVIDEWQYHLQQMVLEEDPIKYLGEFL